MATATVTLKATPKELAIICEALKMYSDVHRKVAQKRPASEALKLEGDVRQKHMHAQNILAKIGYE